MFLFYTNSNVSMHFIISTTVQPHNREDRLFLKVDKPLLKIKGAEVGQAIIAEW